MCYLKTDCLFTNCSHWHDRQTHTSCQHIPISKLSDGSSHFWDLANLQERQPRIVPMCYCHPLYPGMARTALQQPTLLAAACSSQVPNLCQFHTCPPLRCRSGLGYLFIMLKAEGSENPFFPARAELVLSMKRTRVWGDAASYSKRTLHFLRGGIPPGNAEELNLEKQALAAQVLLQPSYWRAAKDTGLGLFPFWMESSISHNSML